MGVLVQDGYVFLRQAHAKLHTAMLPGYYHRLQGNRSSPANAVPLKGWAGWTVVALKLSFTDMLCHTMSLKCR